MGVRLFPLSFCSHVGGGVLTALSCALHPPSSRTGATRLTSTWLCKIGQSEHVHSPVLTLLAPMLTLSLLDGQRRQRDLPQTRETSDHLLTYPPVQSKTTASRKGRRSASRFQGRVRVGRFGTATPPVQVWAAGLAAGLCYLLLPAGVGDGPWVPPRSILSLWCR